MGHNIIIIIIIILVWGTYRVENTAKSIKTRGGKGLKNGSIGDRPRRYILPAGAEGGGGRVEQSSRRVEKKKKNGNTTTTTVGGQSRKPV